MMLRFFFISHADAYAMLLFSRGAPCVAGFAEATPLRF